MSSRRGWVLPAVAGAAVAVMVAVPATRNLLRLQLGGIARFARSPLFAENQATDDAKRRYDAYVAAHKDDVAVQVAATCAVADYPSMSEPPRNADLRRQRGADRARSLSLRFPESPAAQAAATKILAQKCLHIDSAAVRRRLGLPPEKGDNREPKSRNAPGDVALALEITRRGAALAPDNAFFPMFEAGVLANEGRRLEARAAVFRAGRCRAFDDYLGEEAIGRLRITHEAFGDTDALSDLSTTAGVLWPHYMLLRRSSDGILADAEALEAAGNRDLSCDVRLAGMRCGALMRREATWDGGTVAGIAITKVLAEAFPGAPREPDDEGARNQLREQRLSRFAGYLRRMGRGDDAAWVEREAVASDEALKIVRGASQTWWSYETFRPVVLPFIAGAVAVRSAILLLGLGGLAWLVSRSDWARQDKRLPRAAIAGMVVGAVLLPLPPSLIAEGSEFRWIAPWSGIVLAAIGIAAWRKVLSAFLAGATAPVVLSALLWAPGVTQGLRLANPALYPIGLSPDIRNPYGTWLALADSAIPLLLFAGLAVRSLVKRTPVAAGVVNGVRSSAMPLASTLLLLAAVLSVQTLRTDRAMRGSIFRLAQHESREFARLLGRQWPE